MFQTASEDPAGRWSLPNIVDYWDSRTRSIERGAVALDALSPSERIPHILAIRNAVRERSLALSDADLLRVAWIMAEDCYKCVAFLGSWSEGLTDYLSASAPSLLQVMRERRLRLEYYIDNAFEQTEVGMAGPMVWFPRFFNAVGLRYVCAPLLALPEAHLRPEDLPALVSPVSRLELLNRQGWELVPGHLSRLREAMGSFMLLEFGDDGRRFPDLMYDEPQSGVLTAIRTDPPVPGSKCIVVMPAAER